VSKNELAKTEVNGPAASKWFSVSFEQQLLLDNAEEKPASHYNIVYGYHLSESFDPGGLSETLQCRLSKLAI